MKQSTRNFIDDNLPGVAVVAFVILLFGAIMFAGACFNYQDRQAGYAAWSKFTGNPQSLSFQDWDALRNTAPQVLACPKN